MVSVELKLKQLVNNFACTHLTDWKLLRALHTPYSSNDYSIVKEVKIGQSAAKYPVKDKGSTTIPVMGSTLKIKTLGEMVRYYFIYPKVFVYCNMKAIIYTLRDPITDEIRYIGKTKRTLNYRLTQHIQECLKRKMITYKNNWIWSLIQQETLPVIEELETTETENWQDLEKFWIAQFKVWGFRLTNMTDGGDGNQNQIMSIESRIKRSNSLKGKSRPKEVVEKISKSHKGKKLSESTKEKLRVINLGKKYSEESKAKRHKAVIKYSVDNQLLGEYKSLMEASIDTNTSRGSIQNACVGRCKTAGGFKWSYKIV